MPRVRLHDIRLTHGTLLIKAGVPVKVVSERLGHGNPAFTIDTYQHVLPECKPKPPAPSNSSSKSKHPEPPVEGTLEEPPNTVEALVRRGSDQGLLVAGAGFEPATFGLCASTTHFWGARRPGRPAETQPYQTIQPSVSSGCSRSFLGLLWDGCGMDVGWKPPPEEGSEIRKGIR